jgi:hypothetical protein
VIVGQLTRHAGEAKGAVSGDAQPDGAEPRGIVRPDVGRSLVVELELAAKEADAADPDQPNENLVWTTAWAEVVMDDRAERVGGKLHARPSIPAR